MNRAKAADKSFAILEAAMADVFTTRERSAIMSRVRSSGNKATELRLIGIFRMYGIKGWRRNIAIFGSPDFVFPQSRLVVFVDGCFWHGCPLHGSVPSSNREFWRKKLERNKARDRMVSGTLRRLGWRIIRIWQHELIQAEKVATRIAHQLSEGQPAPGVGSPLKES